MLYRIRQKVGAPIAGEVRNFRTKAWGDHRNGKTVPKFASCKVPKLGNTRVPRGTRFAGPGKAGAWQKTHGRLERVRLENATH